MMDESLVLDELLVVARGASCQRSKCASIIVSGGVIIGRGFNSPPGGFSSQCRCGNDKSLYHRKVTDKTCCVHAEQRAMFDALRNNPGELVGSVLYFVRLDDSFSPMPSGSPYCTICSKMALDLGVRSFALFNGVGFTHFDTLGYNDKSFAYSD